MSKFDSANGKGITKYADLPVEREAVEIVAGTFKGQTGIVKKAADGMLTVDIGDQVITVSEASCRPKQTY